MTGLLQIANVSKTFVQRGAVSTVLEGVNLTISHGEFVSIIGHSGCGKSTLLTMVAGLQAPSAGTITLDGARISSPGPDRALVFQQHCLLPWLSVSQNVYEVVDALFSNRTDTDKARHIEAMLRVVGLWDHRDKKPHQISGGMKQRAAVARAFAVRPRLLLLDEPFGALDALTKATLHDELMRLWHADHHPQAVVMVTHDIDEAIYLSDRVVVMTNGPRATIREDVPVGPPRPRNKRAVIQLPEYAALKDHLLHLLSSGFNETAA